MTCKACKNCTLAMTLIFLLVILFVNQPGLSTALILKHSEDCAGCFLLPQSRIPCLQQSLESLPCFRFLIKCYPSHRLCSLNLNNLQVVFIIFYSDWLVYFFYGVFYNLIFSFFLFSFIFVFGLWDVVLSLGFFETRSHQARLKLVIILSASHTIPPYHSLTYFHVCILSVSFLCCVHCSVLYIFADCRCQVIILNSTGD